MRTDDIEDYLCHRQNEDEHAAFEQEMSANPELQEDVKIVSYAIESIVLVGHEQDSQRIRKIKNSIGSDMKRCVASVAAVLVAVFALAAASVPVYKHVVLPIIETLTSDATVHKTSIPKKVSHVVNETVDSTSEVQQTNNNQGVEETSTKANETAAINETQADKSQQDAVVSESTDFVPICKYMGNTMYELSSITGNHNGVLVIDLNVSNEEESVFVELGGNLVINVDGDEYHVSGIQFGNVNKNSASIKKGIPTHLKLTFYVHGKPKNLKLLRIMDNNSAREVRFQNDLPINWK